MRQIQLKQIYILVTLILFHNSIQSDEKQLRRSLYYEESRETISSSLSSSELRYLIFGTSRSYGSGMRDSSLAYPHLLSPSAVNLAMRGSDASYPSMCTETMVGNTNLYDVIIIEYERKELQCTNRLVERLRQRFPNALIIITGMYYMQDFIVEFEDTDDLSQRTRKSVPDVMKEAQFKIFSSEALDYILRLPNIKLRWDSGVYDRMEKMSQIAKQNNAVFYTWPLKGNMRSLLMHGMPLYADPIHLSENGHHYIYKGILDIVKQEQKTRSNVVGSWGDGDFCSSWYQTGKIHANEASDTPIRIASSPITLFDEEKHRYAMELNEPNSTMVVYNPFQGPRKLHLIYLATYPNQIYPKTKAHIVGWSKQNTQASVEINPLAEHYNYPVHIQQSICVGMISSGKNFILLRALEKTEQPLRIVGFAITNEELNLKKVFHKEMLSNSMILQA